MSNYSFNVSPCVSSKHFINIFQLFVVDWLQPMFKMYGYSYEMMWTPTKNGFSVKVKIAKHSLIQDVPCLINRKGVDQEGNILRYPKRQKLIFTAHQDFSSMLINGTSADWRIHQTLFSIHWEPSWDCYHGIFAWLGGVECGRGRYEVRDEISLCNKCENLDPHGLMGPHMP